MAEAARNVACTGARPLGITDCLNFGNPEKPEVFFQFREACRGIADACRAFEHAGHRRQRLVLQREPHRRRRSDADHRHGGPAGACRTTGCPVTSPSPGDEIVILGDTRGELGGSAYWAEVRDFVGGAPPPVDLEAERRLQRLLVAAARQRLLRSAHDCSEGGLAVALAEAAIGGPVCRRRPRRHGSTWMPTPPASGPRGCCTARTAAGRSCPPPPSRLAALDRLAREHRVPRFAPAGRVGTASGSLELRVGGSVFALDCRRPCAGSTSKRFLGGCSIRTWIARRESKHVRHHRRLRHSGRGPAHLPRPLRPAAPGAGERRASWRSTGEGNARSHRGMGLVSENFDDAILARLPGDVAVGHTRYSTTGSTVLANAQPCSVNTRCGPLAIAHNGNLINAAELKRELVEQGAIFTTSSDTEVLVHLIARSEADDGRRPDPGRAGAGGRRLQPGDHRRAHALRGGRQPGLPAAGDRPPGQRDGGGLGDLRARSRRRDHRLRAPAGRLRPDRGRPGRPSCPRLSPPPGEPLRLRAGLFRPARQHRVRRVGRPRPPRAGPPAGPRAARARRAKWCSACPTAPTPWRWGSPRCPASSSSTA